MNKIDTISVASALAPASLSTLEPARRLMVLIPDLEADYVPALRRICELAGAQHAHVLLLGLCKDAMQESGLRRALATLSAMLHADGVLAEAQVEMGTNWVGVVKRNYQIGDMVVCFAEQRAGLLHKPLSQILQSNLKMPVYILSGVFLQRPVWNWRSQVIAWAGFLGIIMGFFLLQVKIVQLPKDGVQNIALVFSIIPEFWLIWVWNSRFG